MLIKIKLLVFAFIVLNLKGCDFKKAKESTYQLDIYSSDDLSKQDISDVIKEIAKPITVGNDAEGEFALIPYIDGKSPILRTNLDEEKSFPLYKNPINSTLSGLREFMKLSNGLRIDEYEKGVIGKNIPKDFISVGKFDNLPKSNQELLIVAFNESPQKLDSLYGIKEFNNLDSLRSFLGFNIQDGNGISKKVVLLYHFKPVVIENGPTGVVEPIEPPKEEEVEKEPIKEFWQIISKSKCVNGSQKVTFKEKSSGKIKEIVRKCQATQDGEVWQLYSTGDCINGLQKVVYMEKNSGKTRTSQEGCKLPPSPPPSKSSNNSENPILRVKGRITIAVNKKDTIK